MSDLFDKLSGAQVLGLLAIVGGILYLIADTVATNWSRVRRVEAETALKRELLAAGKSAEEIEQVVRSTAGKPRT